MDNIEFLFSMSQGENKANEIVASALQEKLALDEPISKDDIIPTIQGIDVSAIVQAIVKSADIAVTDVVDTASSISDYKYSSRISISTINYVNATSIGTGAMANCMPLTSVNMPAATSISTSAMQNCMSLTSVDMPSATSVGNTAMQNCVSLTSVNMPSATSIDTYAMLNCMSLTSVDMPSVTNIGSNAMCNCVSLKSVRLGAHQVATLSNTNAFTNTPISSGTGYIYVPDDLVDSYKTATNWSVYANQIRPMSECEVE